MNHQQAVGKIAHAAQTVDEDSPIRGERMNQVGEIFALDYAGVFHAADGIIAEREGTLLDVSEPSPKAAEKGGVLPAGVRWGPGGGGGLFWCPPPGPPPGGGGGEPGGLAAPIW